MNINPVDLKILRYINRRSRKNTVKTEKLLDVFGGESCIALDNLLSEEYISSSSTAYENDSIVIAGFPDFDNWTVTDKGKYLLKNTRMVQTLTAKERVLYSVLGFFGGILSAVATSFASAVGNYIASMIIP